MQKQLVSYSPKTNFFFPSSRNHINTVNKTSTFKRASLTFLVQFATKPILLTFNVIAANSLPSNQRGVCTSRTSPLKNLRSAWETIGEAFFFLSLLSAALSYLWGFLYLRWFNRIVNVFFHSMWRAQVDLYSQLSRFSRYENTAEKVKSEEQMESFPPNT